MTPLAALRLLWPLALAGLAFAVGAKVNNWRRDSHDLITLQAAEKASTAATSAAVDAIQKIKVRNTTIRQELEREIRYAPVVGTECDISDGVLNALNKALAPPGSDPPRVPGPDAAD